MRYIRDDSGASAAEYALILACIAAGLVTLIINLSTAIGAAINSTAPGFNGVSGG